MANSNLPTSHFQRNFLEDLPLELKIEIVDLLPRFNALHLKASCPYFFNLIGNFDPAELLRVETDPLFYSKMQDYLACSKCQQLRSTTKFSLNAQRGDKARGGSKAGSRLCIDCSLIPDEHGNAALCPGTYVTVDNKTHVVCTQCKKLSLFRKFTKNLCLDCHNQSYNVRPLTIRFASDPSDPPYGYRPGERWSTYGIPSGTEEEAVKLREAAKAQNASSRDSRMLAKLVTPLTPVSISAADRRALKKAYIKSQKGKTAAEKRDLQQAFRESLAKGSRELILPPKLSSPPKQIKPTPIKKPARKLKKPKKLKAKKILDIDKLKDAEQRQFIKDSNLELPFSHSAQLLPEPSNRINLGRAGAISTAKFTAKTKEPFKSSLQSSLTDEELVKGMMLKAEKSKESGHKRFPGWSKARKGKARILPAPKGQNE